MHRTINTASTFNTRSRIPGTSYTLSSPVSEVRRGRLTIPRVNHNASEHSSFDNGHDELQRANTRCSHYRHYSHLQPLTKVNTPRKKNEPLPRNKQGRDLILCSSREKLGHIRTLLASVVRTFV